MAPVSVVCECGTERSNDLARLFSDIGARRQRVLRVGPRCVLECEFGGFAWINRAQDEEYRRGSSGAGNYERCSWVSTSSPPAVSRRDQSVPLYRAFSAFSAIVAVTEKRRGFLHPADRGSIHEGNVRVHLSFLEFTSLPRRTLMSRSLSRTSRCSLYLCYSVVCHVVIV